jgi:hypothetical protein
MWVWMNRTEDVKKSRRRKAEDVNQATGLFWHLHIFFSKNPNNTQHDRVCRLAYH